MTTILTPPGTGDTTPRHDRRRLWIAMVAVVLLVAGAVGVWAFLQRGDDEVAVPEAVTPSAPAAEPEEEQGVVPEPSTPPGQPTPAADCSVAPDREYYTVGATHPCFPAMGQRFGVWLGGAAYHTGAAYEPSAVFTAADVANVRAVQLLMDDVPDGWFGPSEWTRLMTQAPPPVTQLRASGIGPLWFGMTAEQVEATGVARVVTPQDGTAFLEVDGVAGAGCYLPTSSGSGVITAFLTTDPAVTTPAGITPRSTVDDVVAAYGSRLTTRVQQVVTGEGISQQVTIYVVPSGDFALAMWAPPATVGPDSPLVLAAGTRADIDDLQLQSGWCMD